MKKRYVVNVCETYVREYSVHAESEQEAKDLVLEQADSSEDTPREEYSRCVDRELCFVEEVPEKNESVRSPEGVQS